MNKENLARIVGNNIDCPHRRRNKSSQTRDRPPLKALNDLDNRIKQNAKACEEKIKNAEVCQTGENKRRPSGTNDGRCSAGAGSSNKRRKTVALNSEFVTIRPGLTATASTSIEDCDDVFVDASQFFFGSTTTIGRISPIVGREDFPGRRLVSRPENFAQKTTLMRKRNRQLELIEEPLMTDDVLYEEEYLEEYIENAVAEDRKFVDAEFYGKLSPSELGRCFDCYKDRKCAIEWLQTIQAYNFLSTHSCLRTIRLFDLVLRSTNVSANMYQLVVMAALCIVLKYEAQMKQISITRLIAFANNAYTKFELFKMELKLLKFIDVRCDIPEPTIFIEYFICKMKIRNAFFRYSACFFLEVVASTNLFPMISSPLLGAAIFHLLLELLEEDADHWDELKDYAAYYPAGRLVDTKCEIVRVISLVRPDHFVYKRFNVNSRLFVSAILTQKCQKLREVIECQNVGWISCEEPNENAC